MGAPIVAHSPPRAPLLCKELINDVKAAVTIPVIASSGAGVADHFVEVFQKTKADAGLAAGIFHRREVPIREVKLAVKGAGVPVRREGME